MKNFILPLLVIASLWSCSKKEEQKAPQAKGFEMSKYHAAINDHHES